LIEVWDWDGAEKEKLKGGVWLRGEEEEVGCEKGKEWNVPTGDLEGLSDVGVGFKTGNEEKGEGLEEENGFVDGLDVKDEFEGNWVVGDELKGNVLWFGCPVEGEWEKQNEFVEGEKLDDDVGVLFWETGEAVGFGKGGSGGVTESVTKGS
jgi:hypothetical protein